MKTNSLHKEIIKKASALNCSLAKDELENDNLPQKFRYTKLFFPLRKKLSENNSKKFELISNRKNELNGTCKSIWQNLYESSRQLNQINHNKQISKHNKELSDSIEVCSFKPNVSPNLNYYKFKENFIERNKNWNIKMEDK